MSIREAASERGARRGRQLRARTSVELDDARRAAGLSFRELGRRLRVSPDTVQRALRGEAGSLTIDFAARLAAVLGLQLSVGLYPDGDPVRDRAHLALLERLRARLAPGLRWRTEVPIPIAGDHRSGDALIEGHGFSVLVEAETHLHDVQALERTIAAKQRDLGASRVVLLMADTRHNRSVIDHAEELRRRFPIGVRAGLAALARGRDPGGDALLIL